MDTAFWDDAYSNGAYIPGGDAYPAKWASEAARSSSMVRTTPRGAAAPTPARWERSRFT